MFTGMVSAHLDTGYCWVKPSLKEHDSEAVPPVGWQTIEQPIHHSRCAEGGDDCVLSWAFHIHGIGTGAPCQALLFLFPLLLWRGMKENPCERHVPAGRSSPPERSSYNFIKSRIEGFSVCYLECIAQHVGFSPATKDQTHVPSREAQTLNWTTRKDPRIKFWSRVLDEKFCRLPSWGFLFSERIALVL